MLKKLWLPYLEGMEQWPEYNLYPEGACSSCLGLIGFTMEKLKALGEYEKNAGISVVLGRKKELPKGVKPEDMILVGDCLKKHRGVGIFCAGCPPMEGLPLFCILNRQDSEKREATPRSRESEAANTKAFLEHAKKLKEKADSKAK